MPKIDCPPPGFEAMDGARVFNYGHLEPVAAYCRKLGLREVVDRLVPTQMELSPGMVVQAMVLDTLSGRSPLYRLEGFLEEKDAELLLGEDVPPEAFNDTNLARSLDAIFNAGTSKIIAELGVIATSQFSLEATKVSYDTTSTSVWGDYFLCEGDDPPEGPRVTHGHSKDKRPDLKQFMTELLCVERGVPIFGAVLDGNSSDKTSNNKLLTRIGRLMKRHGLGPGAFVYVADSAMMTAKNLEAAGDNLFITRLPASYSACGEAIAEAVDSGVWTDLGKLAEHAGKSGVRHAAYKAHETTVELHGKAYRAVVVHSDNHDKRQRKKLERKLAESRDELERTIKKTTEVYHCEADAAEAAGRAEKHTGRFHRVEASVETFQTRGRGRPPKNGPAPTKTKYALKLEIVEKREAVERMEAMAGCFVLLTNVPREGERSMVSGDVIMTYKGQYGVERNFAFLKDPLIVNDIFLKKPHRIDALGMVLVIALLIWRLMERSMRAYVNNSGNTLPGWNKQRTDRPTSFMMSLAIRGIQGVLTKDGARFLLMKPGPRPREFLHALGLQESVYIDKHSKCTPIIPEKSVSKG
jgi:transposase